MAKLLGLVAAVSFILGFVSATERPAEAYVGQMCFWPSDCAKCEVCVKAKEVDPSGKCMAVAGCH